jgi:hypothetical protein
MLASPELFSIGASSPFGFKYGQPRKNRFEALAI